jgi:hypothetical protein
MQTLRQLLSRILICSTLLAGAALAQSTLTQIRDTVLNSDGTPFNGTVIITWNGFTGPSGGTISPLSTSARIYNGALSVLLVPTTTAASGTYYQAVYNSNDGTVTWTETWQVPPSTTALTLSAIRVSGSSGGGSGSSGSGSGTGTSTGGGQYATLPISISQVTSLSADLASINSSIATLTTQMASLGSSGSTSSNAAFIDDETPAGALNSSNTSFTLAQTPAPAISLSLYRNGLLQTPGIDFTLSGNIVTFQAVSIPKSSDTLAAFYRVTGTAAPSVFVDSETPSGTINGTNLSFTLANTPAPMSSLKLYKNGVLLAQGSDYTTSGSTITFVTAGAAPQSGDTLVAAYRH